MSDIAIRVEGLGKHYRLGSATVRHDTLRDSIAARARAAWGLATRSWPHSRGQTKDQDIWALRDVTFDVRRGEILGVVGRNGAGKSTLLKILSRITAPTEGRARLRGRVGSLLEVGVGFHPDLTARENIFVNGAILGLKRAEIRARFDEIVAFAEVERFVDTPVKHFSSGMYVRLAFAVAAHLEPEILLIDEVLAVGDAGFQQKCLGKMRAVGEHGRTIFFVSHNLSAMNALCQRAIWIDQGRVVEIGPTASIVHRYLDSFGAVEGGNVSSRTDRYGDGRLRVTAIRLGDRLGNPVNAFQSGEPATLVLAYSSHSDRPLRSVLVNVFLSSPWGERICDLQTDLSGENFSQIPAHGEFVCRIPRVTLQPGSYALTFRVYASERQALDIVENATRIEVRPGDFFGRGRLPEPGTIFIEHSWECRTPTMDVSAGESLRGRSLDGAPISVRH